MPGVERQQPSLSFFIEFLTRLLDEALPEGAEDEPQRFLVMVRNRHEVEKGELQIGETQVVRWRMGETFQPAGHVIAEIADGAPIEGRKSRGASDGHASEEIPERRQWIPGTGDPVLASRAPAHA